MKEIKYRKLDKRGQFEDGLVVVISIFIIGVILLFFNRVNDQLYTSLDDYLEGNPDYNGSEAHTSNQDIHNVDNSVWDGAFLAIFIGFLIQIVIFSFATRINMAFFWILVIVDLPILIVGVMLSNVWQEFAADPEFATTILRFPMTNKILGSYYPMITAIIITIILIILFGKRPTAAR